MLNSQVEADFIEQMRQSSPIQERIQDEFAQVIMSSFSTLGTPLFDLYSFQHYQKTLQTCGADSSAVLRIANSKQTPGAILDEIVSNGDILSCSIYLWEAICENPNTYTETLAELFKLAAEYTYIEGTSGQIHFSLPSKTPFVPKQIGSGQKGIRYLLARHPNCPPELLAKFARSRSKDLRAHVASNPSTSPETLEMLIGKFRIYDTHMTAVAGNPNTPAKALESLYANSASPRYLRATITKNPNAPEGIVRKGDAYDIIANPAASAELLLESYNKHPALKIPLLHHPNTPYETRWEIAQENDAYMSQLLANTSLSISRDDLTQLWRDERKNSNPIIRSDRAAWILKNRNVPAHILLDALHTEHAVFRQTMSANAAVLPSSLLLFVREQYKDESTMMLKVYREMEIRVAEYDRRMAIQSKTNTH